MNLSAEKEVWVPAFHVKRMEKTTRFRRYVVTAGATLFRKAD